MTYDYDELYSRYTSYVTDGSVSDLIDWLEGDFDNWHDVGDGPHLTALHGLLSHDEALWLYSQLKKA